LINYLEIYFYIINMCVKTISKLEFLFSIKDITCMILYLKEIDVYHKHFKVITYSLEYS